MNCWKALRIARHAFFATCGGRGSEAPSIVGEDRQFEQEKRATWRVCRDGQVVMKAPYQPRDDPKSKARSGLVDVEALG